MKREYKIPASRWTLIWFPLIVLLQISTILIQWARFIDTPGLKTGWVLLLWILGALLWAVTGVLQIRSAQIITIGEDDTISFQRALGARVWPSEMVTTITEDQIAFHLFSKKREISISKKKTPQELAEVLSESPKRSIEVVSS